MCATERRTGCRCIPEHMHECKHKVHMGRGQLIFACWVIFHVFLSSADFFQNELFQKFFQEHYQRLSNGLDPDQDQHFVGPDLGPNCLQRLSAAD